MILLLYFKNQLTEIGHLFLTCFYKKYRILDRCLYLLEGILVKTRDNSFNGGNFELRRGVGILLLTNTNILCRDDLVLPFWC
jgi:hypothetical protein